MNLRHWKLFLRIAELGSLARAADQTGISQPALSRLLSDLEKGFGVTLFERHARGLRLTEAGERFQERAIYVLREVASTNDIVTKDGELRGHCAIGIAPSLSTVLTVPAMVAYHARFPAVSLRLIEASSVAIRDWLLEGQLDVGVVAQPISEPRLRIEPLFTEGLHLIGPSGSWLNAGEPVTLEKLSSLPLIVNIRPNSLRTIVDLALEREGLSMTPQFEVDGIIPGLVRNGAGYGIVSASGLRNVEVFRDLVAAPIPGLNVTWAIAHLKQPMRKSVRAMFEELCLQGKTLGIQNGGETPADTDTVQ